MDTEDLGLPTSGLIRILNKLKLNQISSGENIRSNNDQLEFLLYAQRQLTDGQQKINKDCKSKNDFSNESQDDINRLKIYLQKKIDDFVLVENKLTKELALKKVAEITESSNDEDQHCKQDELYLWFIESVSNGFYEPEEAQEIAKIIRQVDKLDFCRWYA